VRGAEKGGEPAQGVDQQEVCALIDELIHGSLRVFDPAVKYSEWIGQARGFVWAVGDLADGVTMTERREMATNFDKTRSAGF